MKFESKFFDSVRCSKRSHHQNASDRDAAIPDTCEWPGCERRATHDAPGGRNRDTKRVRFCLEHVRKHNQGYNFFSGMNDAAIRSFRAEALTGHRPTWSMREPGPACFETARLRASSDRFRRVRNPTQPQRHTDGITNNLKRNPTLPEIRSLETLGLSPQVSKADLRNRYKVLVKKFHPDLHGGDKTLEARLKSILQAYSHLKRSGWV